MSRPPRSVARRAGSALIAGGLAVTGTGLLLGPGSSGASSHREAPLISGNPLSDNTDTYAFVSPDDPDTTTLIANWIPFQEPAGGPNFYPWGTGDAYQYDIKIDNDADAVADITYRWTFENIDARGDVEYPSGDPAGETAGEEGLNDGTFLYNNGAVNDFEDPTLLFKQTYDLVAIDGEGASTALVTDGQVAPSYVGNASFPNYASVRDMTIADTSDGGRSFVGQADDPFFLDLRVFDLLYGGNLSEVGSDTLTGYNVNAVALQLPSELLLEGGDDSGIIGVWSTTNQKTLTLGAGTATPTGDFVQVSRLGQPLVNEVVIPAGLKDAFNSLEPANDADVPEAVAKVLDPEVPKLLEAIYELPAPDAPRMDIFSIFLTGLNGLNQPPAFATEDEAGNPVEPTGRPSEMLRLNTAIPPTAEPNRLGALAGDNAGFPNGRRLTDDVVDIELQALAGALTVDGTGAPTGVTLVPALAAGDAVDVNDKAFGATFPYLALPTSGSSTQARGTSVAGGGGGAGGGAGGGGGGGGGGSTPGNSGNAPGGGTSNAPSKGGTAGNSGNTPRGGVQAGGGGTATGTPAGSPALPVGLALAGALLVAGGVTLRVKRG